MTDEKKFDSLAISASAGCGKTQEMATRLLGMFLADTEHPENIFNSTIAMTFSRSGAKEIYNRVLELIFDALLKNEINKLNQDLQKLDFKVPTADKKILTALLRKLIFAVNDLKICTIDSFMSKIVSTFSTELGLPRGTELVSSGEEKILQRNVIKKLLLSAEKNIAQSGEDISDNVEDSHKTVYGQKTRKYHERIKDAILNYQRMLDDNPDAETYIFQGNMTDSFSADNLQAAWDILKDNTHTNFISKTKDKASLADVLKKISTADTETYFNSRELNRMRDFFAAWDALAAQDHKKLPGFGKVKENPFTSDEYKAIQILLYYAAYILLQQNCVRSEGVHSLSRKYREVYKNIFYSQGKLTFADLPRLLNNCNNDWTYDIAYRLNNKFAYYLIDEFQDTSRLQWQVLSAIFGTPAPEDDQSLFIVGDVKQAIYGWRSGDRRLMKQVTDEMHKNIGLEEKPLDLSYRYGKNICTALNHIFNGSSMANGGFFPGVGEAWKNVFKEHNPADMLKYRSLFECYLPEYGIQEKAEAYAQVILNKMREYEIIENRRSCAILVRKNSNGIDLLQELQKDSEYGEYFMWEGSKNICNDKIINALLHLLIYIQHPADTMSEKIAEMLPAVNFLIPKTAEKHIIESSRLNQDGFAEYLKDCFAKLKQNAQEWTPSFKDIESIELFLRSAEEFDRSAVNKDARLFKQYIEEVSHSEEAIGYKVRIMTIHHSKGLTFDHVFTVLFNGENAVAYEKKKSLEGSYPDGKKWILNTVNSELLLFPDIKQAWNAMTVESIFEDFCTMYVALSRAKYTMTVLLPTISKTRNDKINKQKTLTDETSYSFTDYMIVKLFYGDFPTADETFGGYTFKAAKIDEPYKEYPIIKEKSISQSTIYDLSFTPKQGNALYRRKLRPSDGASDEADNKKLYFNLPDPQTGKDFGIELHDFLCSIKDFSNFSFPENCSEKVRKEVAKLLAESEIKKLLADFDECFNELSFDVILDNTSYVSGCFDRVQIRRGADGKVASAVIVDYKSGKYDASKSSDEKRKKYHAQLNLYRKALSQLMLLDITKIECYIIGTDSAFAEKVVQ